VRLATAIAVALFASGCDQVLGSALDAESKGYAERAAAQREWDRRQAECQRDSGRPCEAPEATELRRERQAAAARKAAKPVEAPAGATEVSRPPDLDRAAIAEGVTTVKATVLACGNESVKGTVEVWVRVAATGEVLSVIVKSAPDAALGECVASAIQKATFASTQRGGSFAQPVVF
jgi:hypothetical protein